MRSAWRIAAGGVCGVTAAAIWAVSIAVYQQLLEPTGFFTDPDTGQACPNLASNNTYWPREIRHMAILLAFAGVALICRAGVRGLAAGAAGSAVWLGADLWLDRVDINGRTTAWWLAAAGVVGFAATAGVAAWLESRRPDTSRGRYLAAGTLPACPGSSSGTGRRGPVRRHHGGRRPRPPNRSRATGVAEHQFTAAPGF
jgi:hypothetical protein